MLNTSEPTKNKPAMKNRNMLSFSALALGVALSLTACGGDDHHETAAVDKVDEAAEMARADAPEPEPLEIDETATTTETTDVESTTPEEVEAESGAEEAVAQASAGEEVSASAGKDLFESNCKMCHETGLLGAPKFGNAEDWAPRIAKGKETLYKHSAEGFNQMPAQAVNGVTEEQVAAAVDYMIAQSS